MYVYIYNIYILCVSTSVWNHTYFYNTQTKLLWYLNICFKMGCTKKCSFTVRKNDHPLESETACLVNKTIRTY